MSKVVAEYDTETKELILTIDGVVKNDCTSISISTYSEVETENGKEEVEKYGYFCADFKNIEDNGVVYRMSACGSKMDNTDVIQDYITKSLLKK